MTDHELPTPNRATRRADARRSRKIAAVGSGVALAAGTLGALGALAPEAGAAPAVTNLDDSGPGSLRDAIDNANDGDVIDLTALSGTILLTTGQLNIEDAVTIMGPGASVLSISAGGDSRVINMYNGLDEGQTLTITGLTIRDGDDGAGAGIYFNCTGEGSDSAANLVLDGVVLTNNTTSDLGGALYFDSCDDRGNATISNSVISGNQTTDGRAGGVWFDDSGHLAISNTTISGNTSTESGGGVYFDDGIDLLIVDSTFAHNSAGGSGGAVYLNDADAASLIANSTFNDNHALDGSGGAIGTDADRLSIFQTTISGNTASDGGDGLYMGGYVLPAGAGGSEKQEPDVGATAANSTVVLSGTIIAGNADGTDDVSSDTDNASLETGHSVLGAIDPIITVDDQGGNQFDVSDPGLDPLASNGGPTQTMALKPTSVALNAGPDPVPDFPLNTDDQRGPGFPRVQFGRVDVGAYELQPPPEEEIVEVTPILAG